MNENLCGAASAAAVKAITNRDHRLFCVASSLFRSHADRDVEPCHDKRPAGRVMDARVVDLARIDDDGYALEWRLVQGESFLARGPLPAMREVPREVPRWP